MTQHEQRLLDMKVSEMMSVAAIHIDIGVVDRGARITEIDWGGHIVGFSSETNASVGSPQTERASFLVWLMRHPPIAWDAPSPGVIPEDELLAMGHDRLEGLDIIERRGFHPDKERQVARMARMASRISGG